MRLTGADLDTLAAGTAGIVMAATLYWLRHLVLGVVLIPAGTMLALLFVRYVLTG